MKQYSSNRAQKGKTAFRTPRSFIGKLVAKPKKVERFWGLAKRFERLRTGKKK